MRGSCSSALRSIPSRVPFVRAGPSVLSPAVRTSPCSFPSSSRSFSTTLPSTYRRAHWIASRDSLKEVDTQKPASTSGLLSSLKDRIFEPTSASDSSSSSAAKPPSSSATPSGDLLDQLEDTAGRETNESKINARREQLKKRGIEEKAEKEAKLQEGRKQSAQDTWKPPKNVRKSKLLEEAEKKRKIPIEYKFKTACFKVSPRKLGLIGRQLRSRPIDEAILQMQFSDKRSARRLANAMIQGRNHATELGMRKDKLFIHSVWVGKGATLARINIMGRGRTGIKHHRSARMYFNLIEGKTYMEKEHDQHLKILKSINSRGASAHFKFERTRARIEYAGKGHWRW